MHSFALQMMFKVGKQWDLTLATGIEERCLRSHDVTVRDRSGDTTNNFFITTVDTTVDNYFTAIQ